MHSLCIHSAALLGSFAWDDSWLQFKNLQLKLHWYCQWSTKVWMSFYTYRQFKSYSSEAEKKWMNSFYSLYFRLKLLWSRYLPTWYLAQHAWSPAEWAVVEVGAVAQREERAHRRHAQRTQQPAQDLRRIGAIQQTQYLIWNVSEISLKTLTNLPLLAT